MGIIELTEDNVDEYLEYLSPDSAENIGREYYRGLVVTNDKDKPEAAALWELLHLDDDEKDTEVRIEALKAGGDKAAESLFAACGKQFAEEDVKRSFLELPSEDKGLTAEMLKNAGYEYEETEGSEIVIMLSDLLNMSIAKRNKTPDYIKELGSLMVRPFRRGVMDCIFHSKRPLMEDLGTISMSWFEQQVSSYVETDGRVSGFLLIHKTPMGRLRVEVFTASGPDARKDLLYMIVFSLKQAEKFYPEDTEVVIRRRDDNVKALTDYLLPGFKGIDVLSASREEG